MKYHLLLLLLLPFLHFKIVNENNLLLGLPVLLCLSLLKFQGKVPIFLHIPPQSVDIPLA
jgi:hypothetical protein